MSSAMEIPFCNTWNVNFHECDYTIQMSASETVLSIEVEQDSPPHHRWYGEFSSVYIEDITAKTGNFKKFGTFVKMMLTALNSSSESVFVDLLTYGDLEALRAKKLGKPSQPSSKGNSKRYLILTYAAEFDRAHYPLPLSLDSKPSYETLVTINKRLRSEISNYKEQLQLPFPDQIKELESKCEELTIKLAQKEAYSEEERKCLETQLEMREAYESLRDDYDGLRAESANEIRRLRNENKIAQQKVIELESLSARGGIDTKVRSLKLKCSKLEASLEDEKVTARRQEARHKREMSTLRISFEREQKNNNELRNKLRELNRLRDTSNPRSTSRGRKGTSTTNTNAGSRYPVRSVSPSADTLRQRRKTQQAGLGAASSHRNSGSRLTSSVASSGYGSAGSASSRSRGQRGAGSINTTTAASRRKRAGARVEDGYSSTGSGYDSQESATSRGSRGSSRGRSSVYAPTASSASRQRDKAKPNSHRPDSPISSRQYQKATLDSKRTTAGSGGRYTRKARSTSRDSGYASNDSNGSASSRRSRTSVKSNDGSVKSQSKQQTSHRAVKSTHRQGTVAKTTSTKPPLANASSPPLTSTQTNASNHRPPVYGKGTTKKNTSPSSQPMNSTQIRNRIPLHSPSSAQSSLSEMGQNMVPSPHTSHSLNPILNNENVENKPEVDNFGDASISHLISNKSLPTKGKAGASDELVEPPNLLRQKSHTQKQSQSMSPFRKQDSERGLLIPKSPLRDLSNQACSGERDALELFEKTSSETYEDGLKISDNLLTNNQQNDNQVSKEGGSYGGGGDSLIDNDATAEISDIDRRLNQLQEFLRAAKQTS